MVGQIGTMWRGLVRGACIFLGAMSFVSCPNSLLLNEIANRDQGVYTQLASLSISVGTLTPQFAPATTSYTANVDNSKTSLTVKPVTTQSGVTIKVNDVATSSGSDSAPVSLEVGANTISVTISYPNSAATTYTITVTRLSNVDLSDLQVTAASGQPALTLSPTFVPSVTAYSVSGYKTNTSMTVILTAASSTATLTLNDTAVASGSPNTVDLSTGSADVTIVVTNPDGNTKTYTISAKCATQIVYVPDTSWATQGRLGSDLTSNGCFSIPKYIATDGTNLYVTDVKNNTIQAFGLTGTFIARWTGSQISQGPGHRVLLRFRLLHGLPLRRGGILKPDPQDQVKHGRGGCLVGFKGKRKRTVQRAYRSRG